MRRRIVKTAVWMLIGLIVLELLLRTAGAAYLFLKEHQNRLSEDDVRGAYRILSLGESTTEEGGQYSWPSQLETVLNERSPGQEFRVINAAVGGTNTAFILSELETNLEKYRPHAVITMMGANDGPMYMKYKSPLASGIVAQLGSLRLYRLGRLIQGALNPHVSLADSQVVWRVDDTGSGVQGRGIYGDLGVEYEERGMNNEAIEAYEKHLELSAIGAIGSESDEWTYAQLGRLYYHKDPQDTLRLRTAEEMLKKTLELNPDHRDAYTGLGWVYYHLGTLLKNASLLEEAVIMFREAIELGVDEGLQTHQGLGRAYEDLGRYQEAAGTYEKHIELTEDDWTYTRLSRLYHETGVPDDEIAEFYKRRGVPFEVPGNATAYEVTRNHYRELYRMLEREGIPYIAMQYPTESVEDLKGMFTGDEDVLFVDNEENFRQALDKGAYEDYFIDRSYDSFGHATEKGNRLIAENVADVVLEMLGHHYETTAG